MDAFIDPVTRDYAQADPDRPGTLLRDPADGLANAVYLRVMTPLGSWWADPALGSRLHELSREKDVPRVQRLAQQYCEQALQPLVDDGRVTTLTVTAERQPGRLAVRVELVDAHGRPQQFDIHTKVG